MIHNIVEEMNNWEQIFPIYSSNGNLDYPNLHDGNIIGVLNHDNNSVVIVADYNGKLHAINMIEVEMLKINNYCNGNIILSINICSGNDFDATLWKDELDELYDINDVVSDVGKKRCEENIGLMIDKINRGEMFIISIFPSIGCSLYALFKRADFFKISKFGDALSI